MIYFWLSGFGAGYLICTGLHGLLVQTRANPCRTLRRKGFTPKGETLHE